MKTVMSMEQLQASLRSPKDRSAFRNASPKTPSYAAASPVSKQIRSQILGESNSGCKTPVNATPLSSRRARYEAAKKRHGERLGSPLSYQTTPVQPPFSPAPRKIVEPMASGPKMTVKSGNHAFQSPTTAFETSPFSTVTPKQPVSSSLTSSTETPPLAPIKSTPPSSSSSRVPLERVTNNNNTTVRRSEILSAKLANRSCRAYSWSKTPSTTPTGEKTRTPTTPFSRTPPRAPLYSSAKKTPTPISAKKRITPMSTSKTSLSEKTPPLTGGDSTRRNLDKRTARLVYADSFAADIAKCKQSLSNLLTTGTSPAKSVPNNDAVRVIVRKRPLFAHEAADFDVVHTMEQEKTVCILETRMQADMRTRVVSPLLFTCNQCYDEHATSNTIYKESVEPLVHKAIRDFGAATVLMFGQTGSGKSFTMNAIEQEVAKELFAEVSSKQRTIQVKCVELMGNKCVDLIGNENKEVKLMDSGSSVQFVGATTVTVESVVEFQRILHETKSRRATQSTDKNDTSSRSHSICQITIQPSLTVSSKRCGVLTLVDCAGTERRNDSLYHSKDRQAESSEINASLYALKQCIRAKMSRSLNNHVPYRASKLTRALRESLEQPDASLLVVATVAPNATDTEHSIETLKTVTDLMGAAPEERTTQTTPLPQPRTPSSIPVNASPSVSPRSSVAPKNWTHEQLVAFLTSKRLVSRPIPESMDGRQIMRFAKPQLRHLFFDDDEYDCSQKVDALFFSLRAETDRVARLDFKRRCSLKEISK